MQREKENFTNVPEDVIKLIKRILTHTLLSNKLEVKDKELVSSALSNLESHPKSPSLSLSINVSDENKSLEIKYSDTTIEITDETFYDTGVGIDRELISNFSYEIDGEIKKVGHLNYFERTWHDLLDEEHATIKIYDEL
ncbi:hypothetical protein [Rufibacter psychrotolerans]|uniref:hypothetical protein n=1 Tax=Rufibacter psychrotolerans TaxID=2812556 RepID=UPI001967BF23|nr:hypothetical protein [Rufibacter sp. SYSU D00308]